MSLLPPLPEGRLRPAVLAPSRGAVARGRRRSTRSTRTSSRWPPTCSPPSGPRPAASASPPPQVGVALRVFSLDVTGHPKARTCHGPLVLANPVVVQASRWERGREGCLSVPDLTGDVKRATRLVCAAWSRAPGRSSSSTTDAFEARAFQHEIDHLDGLLFLDRVAGAHALHPRRVYL